MIRLGNRIISLKFNNVNFRQLINKQTKNVPNDEVETNGFVDVCSKTSLKRKYEEAEEEKKIDTLTLIKGMSVPVDGSKVKTKTNKNSMTEAKKIKLEREQV